MLRANLKRRGHSEAHISAALQKLMAAADATVITLYQANLRTYQLLRFGVSVQISAGKSHETVHLVDWEHPKNNDFAIAEGIINNVRKTIIRDQLTDPRFYAEMSKLLDDLIKQSREDAAAYEAFLKKAEELVKRMARKDLGPGVPAVLHDNPAAIVLFNNLASIAATTFLHPADDDAQAKLALELDRAMREHAPAGWKGDDTREKQVLNALFPIMARDRVATQAIFEIIKNQPGY